MHTIPGYRIIESTNPRRYHYGQIHSIWALFNAVSFGSLSKFYSYTTSDLQSKVAKNFNKVNQKKLEQFLSVITKFRNVCAHGERLYSCKTRNGIPNTVLHSKLGIPLNGTQYALGKNDLFAVVIAFRYLLPNEYFKRFKTALISILNHYLKSQGAMTEADMYQYMGFPANWKKITSFQK